MSYTIPEDFYHADHCANCHKDTYYLATNEQGLCDDCLNDPNAMEEFYLKMEQEQREFDLRMDEL